MFTQIVFFGLDAMRLYASSGDTVVISILDKAEASQRPVFNQYKDVLELEFEDTYEEMKLAQPGAWPGNPTEAEHTRFAQRKGEKVPTLVDAKLIVDFLTKYQCSPDSFNLVIHCHQGASRSAAVATWAATRLFVPLGTSRSTAWANPRLLRLLDEASGWY